MRSEGRVKLLNFAYLSLDKKKMLGCGSYSKVYRGKYRGTPVAIKMLFTVDLNPEIIRRCCTEAQLLSDVSHPNVVEIFGVSVLPPRSAISYSVCPHNCTEPLSSRPTTASVLFWRYVNMDPSQMSFVGHQVVVSLVVHYPCAMRIECS